MARSSSPLAIAFIFVSGSLAGVLLERGGVRMSAQQPPPAIQAAAPTGATSAPVLAARGASEDTLYHQLAQQYAQFEPVNRTFTMVARVVSHSVVHIVAQKSAKAEDSNRIRHFEETGSGVIVRGDRVPGLFVLTNNHVVEGATTAKISVHLQDGRALHPVEIWLDPKADVAVLKLNRDDLPAARFGDSDEAAVGDWVLALGSPFGLTHSVSQGIISARGRHMDELLDVENQDFLQTDAAINPGNSGGPLVNMKGEVIGINNSIASNGGGNEGVGFSIPINLARWIMNQLTSNGHVSRGALGIDLHPEFRPEDALSLGLERPRGAWVDIVHAGSPAFRGGLKNGDVILKFQGVDVADLNHLINLVSMAPIGVPADVEVWRERQRHSVKVTVGDRERTIAMSVPPQDRIPGGGRSPGGFLKRPERPDSPTRDVQGVELQTMDETIARTLGLPATLGGAVILKVEPDSRFSAALRPLDVIYSVNGQGIASAEDAIQALAKQPASGSLTVGYDRFVKGGVERRTVRVP